MGYKWNPFTGTLDRVRPSQVLVAAAKLQIQRQCAETIEAGELVKADDDTHVSLATQNSTVSDAQVIGMAIENGDVDDTINILLLGVAEYVAFGAFTVNDPLYLDTDGGIRNTKPTTGKLLPIGKSIGGNQILVQIGEITVLT